MKSSVLSVYFLIMFFAMPALALEASSCAAKGAHLKLSQRSAFMKSCLAQVSSPANVKEAELRHKRALCEQNAKNYKLQGNNRANYTATCINKNEAEAAAKANHNQILASKKAARSARAQADSEVNPKARSKSKAKDARNGKRETTKYRF